MAGDRLCLPREVPAKAAAPSILTDRQGLDYFRTLTITVMTLRRVSKSKATTSGTSVGRALQRLFYRTEPEPALHPHPRQLGKDLSIDWSDRQTTVSVTVRPDRHSSRYWAKQVAQ